MRALKSIDKLSARCSTSKKLAQLWKTLQRPSSFITYSCSCCSGYKILCERARKTRWFPSLKLGHFAGLSFLLVPALRFPPLCGGSRKLSSQPERRVRGAAGPYLFPGDAGQGGPPMGLAAAAGHLGGHHGAGPPPPLKHRDLFLGPSDQLGPEMLPRSRPRVLRQDLLHVPGQEDPQHAGQVRQVRSPGNLEPL